MSNASINVVYFYMLKGINSIKKRTIWDDNLSLFFLLQDLKIIKNRNTFNVVLNTNKKNQIIFFKWTFDTVM